MGVGEGVRGGWGSLARTCAPAADAANIALGVSGAVMARVLLAPAVLGRHRPGLDAAAAAGYALKTAAVHAESVLVT